MVPVLSNSNTSISPAVSTALPDFVITLARSARSIPAIPMADNNPPMVVGMRQTNREINAAMVIGVWAYTAKGPSVTQTIIKIMVNPASKMVRAISLGVFWRLAPSTNAIILSKKLSPGSVVTFTFMESDKTLVPPVTLDLSPPDSLITGALSPVMADSSIVARPSTISPSIGIVSPASQTNTSPFFSWEEEMILISFTYISPQGTTSLAGVSSLVFLRLSACALPLASAMASAKFANSTVNKRIINMARL